MICQTPSKDSRQMRIRDRPMNVYVRRGKSIRARMVHRDLSIWVHQQMQHVVPRIRHLPVVPANLLRATHKYGLRHVLDITLSPLAFDSVHPFCFVFERKQHCAYLCQMHQHQLQCSPNMPCSFIPSASNLSRVCNLYLPFSLVPCSFFFRKTSS